jgi:hypothetical protein
MGSVNDAADLIWAVSLQIRIYKLRGVIDTADMWWAVSMTPLTKYDTADQWDSNFDML